ncbi:MAG: hypothetical protein KGZ58_06060 [Ignavibacteriales bacterium]|nr:hypothetical protein [Ignavibacteriales bacterium]
MTTEIKKKGRPNTGKALTNAEKQRRYRAKQKNLLDQAIQKPSEKQKIEELEQQVAWLKKEVIFHCNRANEYTEKLKKAKQ